ncbi:MAG: mannosyltransferase family protein [Thermomicrobiales bacterium]
MRALPRLGYYPAQLPDAFLAGVPALDGWARWDTAHYVAVARLGYGDPASPSPHGGVGFFPLYPLLMRGLVEIVGVAATPATLAVAGIVVANVSFLLAVPLFARLAADHVGEKAARQSVALLCLAPLGFFFNAAYSESLFLALAAGSLLAARRDRRWLAAGLAGLASGSRLFGLALAPALLLGAWRRGASRRDLLATAILSPLGALLTTLYLWVETGTAFAYFRAQATWGGWDDHVRAYAILFARHPGETFMGDPRHLIIILNVLLGIVALAALPSVWRRLDPSTALFTTLIVVVHAGFTWVSLGRYLLPAIGVWVVLGELVTRPRWRGWPRDVAFVTSAILLTLMTVLFSHGFWVV